MTPDILKLLSNIADNKFKLNAEIGFVPRGIVYIGIMAFTVGFCLMVLKFLFFQK